MDSIKDCKISECVRTHRCKVVGLILLIIATILTIFTLSGLGIFAMFLVGGVFCMGHGLCRSNCCSCCSCCHCEPKTESCSPMMKENATTAQKKSRVKKVKPDVTNL